MEASGKDANARERKRQLSDRLTSPRVVFSALALTFLLVVLLTPQPRSERVNSLDSRATEARGARALYELAGRLGWPTVRRLDPIVAPLDTAAVHLVLEPDREIMSSDIAALLDAVRAGAGLVVVAPPREFRDSLWNALGARPSARTGPLTTGFETEAGSCPASLRQHGVLTWQGDRIISYALELSAASRPEEVFATVDRPTEALRLERQAIAAELRGDSAAVDSLRRANARVGVISVGGDRSRQEAAAGFTLGRGRIAYIADADLLRNDVIRYCPWGADLLAVRMLEWVADGERKLLVFDESHRPIELGKWYVRLGRMLTGTADGRVALTLMIAAAALVVALGRRPLTPVSVRALERRSPLEHVDALARAYSQAHATRTAARRLVRGLRRRHAALTRNEDDDAFLTRVADRHPALVEDVDVLRRASRERIPNADLDRLLKAVDAVDQTLTSP